MEFLSEYNFDIKKQNENLIFTLWANVVSIFPNVPTRLGSRLNRTIICYVLWVPMRFKCYENYILFPLLFFGFLFIQISHIENHNETEEFTSTSQDVKAIDSPIKT